MFHVLYPLLTLSITSHNISAPLRDLYCLAFFLGVASLNSIAKFYQILQKRRYDYRLQCPVKISETSLSLLKHVHPEIVRQYNCPKCYTNQALSCV